MKINNKVKTLIIMVFIGAMCLGFVSVLANTPNTQNKTSTNTFNSQAQTNTNPLQGKVQSATAGNPTVAVLMDQLSWGYNLTTILTNYGISYNVISSSNFGKVSLAQYQKVIIAASQTQAFNDAVTSNRTWFENYVSNGGILEIDAANNSLWNAPLPGGASFVSSFNNTITINDPYSPLMNTPNVITSSELQNWGWSAHGYLTGVSFSDSIATSYGHVVLATQRFGNGLIILSSQTLEYGWGIGKSNLLENVVLYRPQLNKTAVLMDRLSWGYNLTTILTNHNIPFDVINSSYFGKVSLAQYQKVIIAASQLQGFNDAVTSNRTWFENYVSNGGILEIDAANNSLWNAPLPGGASFVSFLNNTITINDPYSPLMNTPNVITSTELQNWGWSAHGYLTGVTFNDIIATSYGHTVLATQRFGNGLIILTSQPLEYGWGIGKSNLLENVVLYKPQLNKMAVLMDQLSWGFNLTTILTNHSIPYDVINSSYFGKVSLAQYQKVVIPSNSNQQDQAFNNAVLNNKAWLENYVSNGGLLEIDAATNAVWNTSLPGGANYVASPSNSITVNDPSSPLMNTPNNITTAELQNWGSSVHGYLTGVTFSDIVLTSSGKTVLATQNYGNGHLILTTQTLEYGYNNKYSRILENVLLYTDLVPPTIVSSSGPLTYDEGTTGNSIFFSASDPNPSTYAIYNQATLVQTGYWVSLSDISINVDGLSVGSHTYSIMFYDLSNNVLKTSVVVTVVDVTNPVITFAPSATSYVAGSTGNYLSWTATDLHPGTYSVTENGASFTSGSWTSGNSVQINIDGLSAGTYKFNMTFFDASNNYVSNTVAVTVSNPVTSGPTTTTSGNTVTSGTSPASSSPGSTSQSQANTSNNNVSSSTPKLNTSPGFEAIILITLLSFIATLRYRSRRK